MMRRLLVFVFVLTSLPLFATTYYVSQPGGSLACGTDGTQTTISVATLVGDSTRWQPDNVIKLCGIITSEIYAQGGGSAGHVLTILFETGAAIHISPGADASGALNLGGTGYIVVDGGSACGWNTATNASEGACNGQIENMLYGSPGATCPGGTCTTQPAGTSCGGNFLVGGASSNNEIKNLEVGPAYIHTSSSNDQFGTPGVCVNSQNNWTIHHSKLHDGGWHTTVTASS